MTILQMSFSASVMILFVLLVRAFTLHRLPKKTFPLLWGIILLRLLVPFSIPSPVSVYSQLEHTPIAKQPVSQVVFPLSSPVLAHPVMPKPTTLLWLCGFLLCAAYFIYAYLHCRRKFMLAECIKNAFTEAWIAAHPMHRTVTVKQAPHACLTYGIFHPVIILPTETDWTDTQTLTYIFAHEWIHIQRFDALYKVLLSIAFCVHWFNPLVWILFYFANRDLELSCDAAVISPLAQKERARYAMTLLHAEETMHHPTCSHFRANALTERIAAIMKAKKISCLAISIAVVLSISIAAVFATSAIPTTQPIPNTDFSKEEYAQLLALQFDGYQRMSIQDFRNKVWTLTDTTPYLELLERFYQDETLFELRDDNDTASFLFYILNPLTSRADQARCFSGYTTAAFEGEQAILEYGFTFEVLDAEKLTVGAYDRARREFLHGVQSFLQSKTKAQLQDADQMTAALDTEIEKLQKKWCSDRLKISTEFVSFRPLRPEESQPPSTEIERRTPYGTQEQYDSLFTLKTSGYQNMPLADFNLALLDWTNEHFDAMESISEDAASLDFHVPLTEEEQTFVTLTVSASGMENAKAVQSSYTGESAEDPSWYGISLDKHVQTSNYSAFCTLYLDFSYHITDYKKLTVGQRDAALAEFLQAIHAFWEQTSLDMLLTMEEADIVQQLQALAAQSSIPHLTFFTEADRVHFEHLAEPISN